MFTIKKRGISALFGNGNNDKNTFQSSVPLGLRQGPPATTFKSKTPFI